MITLGCKKVTNVASWRPYFGWRSFSWCQVVNWISNDFQNSCKALANSNNAFNLFAPTILIFKKCVWLSKWVWFRRNWFDLETSCCSDVLSKYFLAKGGAPVWFMFVDYWVWWFSALTMLCDAALWSSIFRDVLSAELSSMIIAEQSRCR